jgi:hypothetical protein
MVLDNLDSRGPSIDSLAVDVKTVDKNVSDVLREIEKLSWDKARDHYLHEGEMHHPVNWEANILIDNFLLPAKFLFDKKFDEFADGKLTYKDLFQDIDSSDTNSLFDIVGERLRRLEAVRILFPKNLDHFDFLDRAFWDEVNSRYELRRRELISLGRHVSAAEVRTFADYVIAVKIVEPEEFKKLNFGEEEKRLVQSVSRIDLDNITGLMHRLAMYKIAFPHDYHIVSPSSQNWKNIFDEIEIRSQLPQEKYLMAILGYAKILIADDIKLTPNGIQINLPIMESDTVRELPEERRY